MVLQHPFNFKRMQKSIQSCLLFLLLACAGNIKAVAQSADYASSKEKIYIQTSHVFFKPGEQVYFKLYLVDAKDQRPSHQSSVAYVEILNPSGNVISKMNYKVENGYTEGSFDFGYDAVGGIYRIRAFTTWMQNEKESKYFVKDITLQKVIAPRVLMKLDFPKKGYGPGDEVTAEYSIRNLNDQPIRNYEAKFSVSIAGKVIETTKFQTDHEGRAKIKFNLPRDLSSNDGLLNILINYDSYTESISRSIPIVLNRIDLQFMPEGGTLVEGLPTFIAFKALNENGKAADIKGEVWDNNGNKVSSFESFHFGMGKFSFTPQKGKAYTVRVTSPVNITQQYKLPAASANGVIMNILRKNDRIVARLTSNLEARISLAGATKNVEYFRKEFMLKAGDQEIEIDPSKFPTGIARFTIYNEAGLPVAERICFLNEEKLLQVKITMNKQKYLPREKVTMTVQTLDEQGKPVPSNLSLAVMDDKLWSLADDKQDHILSWLLMSSELNGKVEEPQFYFKKDEVKAMPALDLVMLTHGYRYFDYIEYVEKEKKLRYTHDLDNVLSGVIVNERSMPVKASVLLINANNGGKAMNVTTGNDGVFFFSDVPPVGNYYIIARSLDRKEKVTVKVQQKGIGYNPFLAMQFKSVVPVERVFAALGPVTPLMEKPKTEEKVFGFAQFGKTVNNLEEVVVIGYGTMRKQAMTGAVAMVRADDIRQLNNVENALQGRVAGIEIVQQANPGAGGLINLRGARSISGGNEPLFVINGVPVSKFDWNINHGDISSITILKDASAVAIYGARAANGVIIVETKKIRGEKIRFDLTPEYYYSTLYVQPSPVSYAVARRFYAPKYNSLQASERNDFRETIYWNPVVQTDRNGIATLSFYNSDASTTFRAIAEGIGYNGKPGRAETTYAAQSPMSVDAKIPPYLTVGDKALIPLVIKNNFPQAMSATIEMSLPSTMKVGQYSTSITVEAESSTQVLVPVEAIAATNGRIGFMIRGSYNTETLSLPIVAGDKGFPVIETFSGNRSGQHQFNINKMVPGSLSSKLKLFSDLEGQLLDGIESMLREPYGCFEQTSSTTYPNIYVLKYLRESGKSNPAIEKKAMDYIERGYKRLIGFETSAGGFEWFGHTPPHEALTAYGLLEFTDMQEFINVDKQMLDRTKNYLLRRRDGKGEFMLATGGYDRFASVPNKIANIYIVYALTQAGVGQEIRLEYETAVKKALAGNDAYQLAMMAIAAKNMKNEKDFASLMEKLNENYKKLDLSCETSVVNSRDASLRVEAMSLYVLALARESSPRLGLMAELITRILGEKTYYGYGSTQSTVLALNAVVEYSKLVGEIAKESSVEFVLNNQKAMPGNQPDGALKDGDNALAIRYSNESNTIPYNFEVSYYTFTPPNSAKAELKLSTSLLDDQVKTGETVRLEVEVKNEKSMLQPMAIAKIGIPAGLSAQPWQLKEIMEKKQVAYYEIFDNYLVFYWMGFAPNETKKINLDLKAEVPGTYIGKAATTYLYYTPEHKHWNEGLKVEVTP
jgi:alpha-2-macroglobulin-like protein